MTQPAVKVPVCPICGNDLIQPDGPGHYVCPNCGWVFPDLATKLEERLTESRQLTSPGLVDQGLGESQKSVITAYHELGLRAQQKDPERFTGEGYLLSLTDLWSGNSDESFWIRLTQHLKDRGVSPERIALICAAIRQEISHLDRERNKELADILRRFGIE